MPDKSNTSAIRATRVQHECGTRDRRATQVTRVQHKCDTSATLTTRVRNESYTNDPSATQVKNFDFDNDMILNIFAHPYIYYMASQRL